MARFRGTVRGGRGTGSRLGHTNTGLNAEASSWNGSIEVSLWVKKTSDEDYATVWHKDGAGRTTCLYQGPLNKHEPVTPWVEVPWKVEPVSLTSEVTHAKE
jgi:hypothetical protein